MEEKAEKKAVQKELANLIAAKSKYYANSVSASCHIIIFDDRAVALKPNIQLSFDLSETSCRIIHRGNDYGAGDAVLTDAAKN
ncbi:MAG: hypothetical protein LBN30_05540 [Oscillospiraceae bacterium]|jgi:hypothetical protein|nr:hypothetical protein [Oscillospiraceae bacterium]